MIHKDIGRRVLRQADGPNLSNRCLLRSVSPSGLLTCTFTDSSTTVDIPLGSLPIMASKLMYLSGLSLYFEANITVSLRCGCPYDKILKTPLVHTSWQFDEILSCVLLIRGGKQVRFFFNPLSKV